MNLSGIGRIGIVLSRATVLLLCAFSVSAHGQAAPTNSRAKLAAQLSLQSLRGLPANAQVETKRGRVVSAAHVLALADAMRAAKQASRQPSPRMFARPTAPAVAQVRNTNELSAALARNPSDVVQLSNGVKMTAGDLQKLSPLMQRLNGRTVAQVAATAPQRPNLSGAATKISSARDLEKLKNNPDSTILENKNGARVTLGELREAAKKKQGR